jgi:hypothetical protein
MIGKDFDRPLFFGSTTMERCSIIDLVVDGDATCMARAFMVLYRVGEQVMKLPLETFAAPGLIPVRSTDHFLNL